MEKRIINGDDYIHVYDMYEWTIKQLETNTLNLDAQKHVLDIINNMGYLKNIMSNKVVAIHMMDKLIDGINDGSTPLDIYSISYVHYACKNHGLNTDLLKAVIDAHSEDIIQASFDNKMKIKTI
jgi:hypothetical protein